MNTNSISSNKVTLKISTPQGKEMALNKGEVLQAQVQELGDDGLVTIVVKGKPIEAYTEVAVKPGQQLLLMVDDVKNGKTYLKVVTPEMMGKIENTNISANLLDMGIAAREENIVLSRKLLQHNLPVNQSNLNELNKNVSALGGMNARNLEIAAFALSRGITGKNALESLAQFLASPGDTAKLIPVIGRLLNALDAQNMNSLLEGNPNVMNKAGTVLASPVEQSRFNNQFSQLNQALSSLLNEETTNQITASKNSLSSSVVTGNGAAAIDESQASASKSTVQAGQQLIESKNSISSPVGGGSGSTPNSASAVPGNSSQASPSLNIDSQTNAAADKQVQSGAAGPDGEEASSSSKLTLSGTSADKLNSAAGKGEVPSGQNNTGNEKVPGNQPAGSGTNNSAINVKGSDSAGGTSDPNSLAKNNTSAPLPDGTKAASARIQNQAGNTLSAESPQPEEATGSNNKANPSADIKVKPELVLSDTGITTGVKNEEQLTGTRILTNVAVSGDESQVAQTLITGDDEIVERLMGNEDTSAKKITGPESLLARETLKQELVKLLDIMRSLMEIDLKAAPEKIAGQLQGTNNSEKDIIRALSLLVEMAKNQDMVAKVPELKDFSLSLDKLEKEITGQQLFNVGSRNATDNMSSFYYFAFPVKIDQEYSLCQLKINKDGRKSLKDVDKLSFVVSLNTSKLGVVLFHINWQKIGNLQLQGVVQNQASCNYLNQNMGELVSKLEALGYQVKNMGVKVSSSAEEIRVRPVLQEVNEKLRPLGIDVTV